MARAMIMWSHGNGRGGRPSARLLTCVECLSVSGLRAAGWRGYRTDDPTDPSDAPAVAFYCPACAVREFGVATRAYWS